MEDPFDQPAGPVRLPDALSKGGVQLSAILAPLLLTTKKTKWLGDEVADVSFRDRRALRWMSHCTEFLSIGRTLLFNLILAFVIFAFLLMLFLEVKRRAVTIHPVPVPEKLSKSGYTADVVAVRVSAELQRIWKQSRTLKPRQGIVAQQSQIEFQLPGQLVSFRTLVRFVRALVGIENTEVSIDVVEDQSVYRAQIRVAGGAYDGASRTATAPSSGKMDDFIREIGWAAMREAEPYILASYEMAREEVSCSKNGKCEFRKSLAILDELVKRRSIPDFKWTLVELSYIRDAQKRYEESAEFARKAIAVDSKFAPAYTSLGDALRGLERPEEAIKNYKEAIELDPYHYHAYNGWGKALLDLEQPDQAIEKFRKTIEIGTSDPFTYYNFSVYNSWGHALMYLKRPEQAIDKYKAAIDLEPTNPVLYENWGHALLELKQPQQANEKFRKATEIRRQ